MKIRYKSCAFGERTSGSRCGERRGKKFPDVAVEEGKLRRSRRLLAWLQFRRVNLRSSCSTGCCCVRSLVLLLFIIIIIKHCIRGHLGFKSAN